MHIRKKGEWNLKKIFSSETPESISIKLCWNSYVRLWGPSWSKGRTAGHIFGREPSNDYFIKMLFLLSKCPMGNSHKNLLVWNLWVAQLEPNFNKIAVGWSSSKSQRWYSMSNQRHGRPLTDVGPTLEIRHWNVGPTSSQLVAPTSTRIIQHLSCITTKQTITLFVTFSVPTNVRVY
jgi:hypothetical protein